MNRANENISPKVLNLILRHLSALQQEKMDGVQLVPVGEDLAEVSDCIYVSAAIDGPAGTPYHGGRYGVKICIGAEFPAQPPRAVFLTKIFHPNISASGEVCVNTLKRDWDPQNWSIGHILQVIRCLLIVPFPESALNEEAGRLFMESYADYAAHAAMINRVHALAAANASPPAADEKAGAVAAVDAGADAARRKSAEKVAAQKAKKSLRRL
mmetsp:Transcript_10351/g.30023  ORF Transcript_10351/g.30023 Transcript_10351/m.30023 type:complete len:212 (+) Transcript_10351:77-712(+)